MLICHCHDSVSGRSRTASLPLDRDSIRTIALIGPHLNSTKDLLGNYFGVPPFHISPAQGIEMVLDGYQTSIIMADGCPDIECDSTAGIDTAVSAAKVGGSRKRAKLTQLFILLSE